MEEIYKAEQCILFAFYELNSDYEEETFPYVRNLRKGEYLEVLKSSVCEETFRDSLLNVPQDEMIEDSLQKASLQYLDDNSSDPKKALALLCCGVAALSAWLQDGWTGPPLSAASAPIWLQAAASGETAARAELERPAAGDAAAAATLHWPQLLLLARASLWVCAHHAANMLRTAGWWWQRAVFAHQQALGEPVPALHDALMPLLSVPPLPDCPLLQLEAARVHLWYGRLSAARSLVEAACAAAGLRLELTGEMGRRTRYQQRDLAQLVLKVEVEQSAQGLHQPGDALPKDLQLNDEVRLERVQLADAAADLQAASDLSPEQQAVLLATFVLQQKAQPQDELANEELLPYLQRVLDRPQWWSLQATALALRCRLEGRHRRTVERAMMQLQELVSAVERPEPGSAQRLPGLFCCALPPRPALQAQLAAALAALGCVQGALDLYLQLGDLEQAVACYTQLGLRHKAAELLRAELAQRESVLLLCLLGDATDDPLQYERAWELSGERSARAQRHWGLYLFRRQQYAESVAHLQQSLACNSLQPELWLRLGFATLQTHQWELSASAYRHYCDLNPDNLEAWNNLAKAYVKLGQKTRAWRALQEALRADYENWQLWDNVLGVSAGCGAFEEAVRAYHRLLDLRAGRHIDVPVLRLLVRAALEDLPDHAGQGSARLLSPLLKLFGRITAQVAGEAEVWQLYAQLTAAVPEQTQQTRERTAQFLQRAHRAATQQGPWARERESCRTVLALTRQLADAYLACSDGCPPEHATRLLSSARLAVKGVLASCKQSEQGQELAEEVQQLEERLRAVELAAQQQQ